MLRLKRTLAWLLAVVLIVAVFPAQLVQRADAATSSSLPAYFFPDNVTLRNTASLVTYVDQTGTAQIISRDNVYIADAGKLTINGTINNLSGQDMNVKVEQLTYKGDEQKWVTDATHVMTGVVSLVTGTTNRFSASDLTLFPGFNKITLTGMLGNTQRTDVFYALYDGAPYVESIKALGSSAGALTLNENTQVVVDAQNIALSGTVRNATSVSVSLNGAKAILSPISSDVFYTPTLSLTAGVNTVKLTISNGTDSIDVTRSIFYFDHDQPFTKIDMTQTGYTTSQSLLNNVPTFSDGTSAPGSESSSFTFQVLVPYGANSGFDFAGHASLLIAPSSATTTGTGTTIPASDVSEEMIIPGPDGVTPAYRLVTFKSPASAYTFTSNNDPTKLDSLQSLRITVTYGTFSATYNAKFNFQPGQTVIKNMYYLPDYATSGSYDAKEPLNGATVPQSDFYILVETDKAIATDLHGLYLPLSTKEVTLSSVTGVTGLNANQAIYHITGFSSGVQQVKFVYGSTTNPGYTATITYAAKSYIYLDNVYDGMTYTFNSKTGPGAITVNGKYIGFEGMDPNAVQFFVNGKEQTAPTLTQSGSTYSFSVNLPVDATGNYLYPGQNTLVFKGVNTDAAGNRTEVTKSVRIFVVDQNIPDISKFQPAEAPNNNIREPFYSADPTAYTEQQLNNIFSLSTAFTKKDSTIYETSKKTYDLVIRGGGTQFVNLYKGSDLFFTPILKDTNELTNGGTFDYNGKTYAYDLAGSRDNFILRIKNISFDENSLADIYTLELINPAGARATQNLEIDRVLTSYRIIAPQPTVGNDIVVNKNFVHFDIEAEGATQVLIGKDPATPRQDLDGRFEYDYIGLKAGKSNAIKIQIVRPGSTINDTVNVFYTDSVQVDSQYMQAMNTKVSVFNKGLQLTFPKGTVLMSAQKNSNGVTKYYPDANLLFGIADPTDGVVGRRNDYGNVINRIQTTTDENRPIVQIPQYLSIKFLSNTYTNNFTPVSQIYWISGGEGEYLDKGVAGYKPSTNGLQPYSGEGNFTEFPLERKVVPSSRGTLTLTFDSNVVTDAGTTLTVFRYASDGVWENIGGEVNSKAHTITVPFSEFGYYKVMKLSKSYTDITNHYWARNILNALYAKGIMPAIGAGTFGADDLATRGEFATLLVKGLNIPLNYDNNNTFYDVVPSSVSGAWSYKYIETAARAGIINGLSEGFFSPDGKLTREEAAMMTARALQLALPTNDSKLDAALSKLYLDSGTISYYAKPAISAISKAKIMAGSPITVAGSKKTFYNFNPRSFLTRAEAGKIAVALLQKSTKLFPSNLS